MRPAPAPRARGRSPVWRPLLAAVFLATGLAVQPQPPSAAITPPPAATTPSPGPAPVLTQSAVVAPGPPSVTIEDGSGTEGGPGADREMDFVLRLSGPAGSDGATVRYTTADGTAVAPADYKAKRGTVTFAPGETQQTLTVETAGDSVDEDRETFFVNLSNPSNATIADPQTVGSITDDDPLIIDNLAGGPGLVDRLVVEAPESGTRLLRLCVDPRRSPCIDFSGLPAGNGPNPRTEQGLTFSVFGEAGTLLPQTGIVDAGGVRGLDAARELEIRLPSGAPGVELTLAHDAAPGTVEAFHVDGTRAGRATMGDRRGEPETIRLPRVPALEVAQQPFAVAAAGDFVYVADPVNYLVRFLDPRRNESTACPCETVFAGNGSMGSPAERAGPLLTQLTGPYALAVVTTGRTPATYIADTYGHRILRVATEETGSPPATTSRITTVAGTGTLGFAGDGGPASRAQLNSPYGVAHDPDRNVTYVADSLNHRIRAIRPDGSITTVVGTGVAGYGGDGGPAPQAQLNRPRGLALDRAGRLFIADTFNHAVRRLEPASGLITTVAGDGTAGYGGDESAARAARLNAPSAVAVDGADPANLYIADTGNNRVRRVAGRGGRITTLAGTGEAGYRGDGGDAKRARLDAPFGVTVRPNGDVVIADTGNNRVRLVQGRQRGNRIETVAGNATPSYSGNDVPSSQTQMGGASSVSTVNLYESDTSIVADPFTHTVRMVRRGDTETLAGNGRPGRSAERGDTAEAKLAYPFGVVADVVEDDDSGSSLLVYVADTFNNVVRRIEGERITTVAGDGTAGYGGDGGPANRAGLSFPTGVALDGVGNLYIADAYNARIRKVDRRGVITTVAGTGRLGFSGDGGPATAADLYFPYGVTTDGARPANLYITDSFNHRVRRVDGRSGVITTVAGNGVAGHAGDGRPAVAGSLNRPWSVTLDGGDRPDMHIADTFNHRIRRVDGRSGVLSTLAALGLPGDQGDLGPATGSLVSAPRGFSVVRDELFVVADSFSNRLRRIGAPLTYPLPEPVALQGTSFDVDCRAGAPAVCPTQRVDIFNSGDATLVVSAVALGGEHPGDFSLSGDRCTDAKLPPGEKCSLEVTFQPTLACDSAVPCRHALLRISGNGGDSVREVALDGTAAKQQAALTTASDPAGEGVVSGTVSSTLTSLVGEAAETVGQTAGSLLGPGPGATAVVPPSLARPLPPLSVDATDTATASGPSGRRPPTGTVSFFLCGPTEATDAGCPAGGTAIGGPKALDNGRAVSDSTNSAGHSTSAAGKYCWRAEYSGDGFYLPGTHTNGLTSAEGGGVVQQLVGPDAITGETPECFVHSVTSVPPITTTPVSPTIETSANGYTDMVTVTGPPDRPVPTGTVSFFICGPTEITDAGCPAGGTAIGKPKTLVNGSATSDSAGASTSAEGKYCWRAQYSPDGPGAVNYSPASHTNGLMFQPKGECFFEEVEVIK